MQLYLTHCFLLTRGIRYHRPRFTPMPATLRSVARVAAIAIFGALCGALVGLELARSVGPCAAHGLRGWFGSCRSAITPPTNTYWEGRKNGALYSRHGIVQSLARTHAADALSMLDVGSFVPNAVASFDCAQNAARDATGGRSADRVGAVRDAAYVDIRRRAARGGRRAGNVKRNFVETSTRTARNRTHATCGGSVIVAPRQSINQHKGTGTCAERPAFRTARTRPSPWELIPTPHAPAGRPNDAHALLHYRSPHTHAPTHTYTHALALVGDGSDEEGRAVLVEELGLVQHQPLLGRIAAGEEQGRLGATRVVG